MIALHRKFADVICEWITEKGNMAFSKSTSFKSQHSAKCLSWHIRIKSVWLFVDAKLNGQPVVPAAPCTLPSHHLHRTYLASAFFRLALWPLLVKRRLVKVNVSQNRLLIKSCQKATVFPTRLLILPFSSKIAKLTTASTQSGEARNEPALQLASQRGGTEILGCTGRCLQCCAFSRWLIHNAFRKEKKWDRNIWSSVVVAEEIPVY